MTTGQPPCPEVSVVASPCEWSPWAAGSVVAAPWAASPWASASPWAESPWPQCSEAGLRALVKAAFAQRRKTLRNNLKAIIDSTQLEALGIDPGARAETLQLTQFIEITNAIHVQNSV